MIRVFLCNSNTIILEGLKSFLKSSAEIAFVGSKTVSDKLLVDITQTSPDVIIMDYTSEFFDLNDVKQIMTVFPTIQIIGLTDYKNREVYASALGLGMKGHLLNCCDQQEVIDSIKAVHKGDSFYCGKVLEAVHAFEEKTKTLTCAPVVLSVRELEVITLIAEGLTNKEIADQLCLSSHTVMTHRKNIMSKLGLTNTAGIVLYAVKQHLISPNKFLFETRN